MTYFNKHQIQGLDPSGDPIDLSANAEGNQIVADFRLEISKGNVSGHSNVIAAASNVGLDIGTETIWKSTGLWVPMATARTMSVVSTDANDTSAGTGARTVLVTGVDAAGAAQIEFITMNGTTPVITTLTWGGLNTCVVLTAGTSVSNEGDITFTSTTDAELQTIIAIGDSLSSALVYHVPVGSTFYLKQIRTSLYRSSGADADVVAKGYVLSGGVRANIYEVDINESIMPLDTLILQTFSAIAGGSIFYMEGTSDKNGVTVRAAFEGIQVVD